MAISTGLIAFSATNVDDIVILLLFFSQVNSTFRPWHIVVGQYLGFTVLVILSLPGFFGGLILPQNWLGLLGLMPITMGMSNLVNRETKPTTEVVEETTLSQTSVLASFLSPQTYNVAAVTIANGSDNISVYVSLFASSNLGNLFIIISLFFFLLAIWCYAAYKLTHQQGIADVLTRYGSQIVPFVLMGLGGFIVWKSGALSPIKLVVCCICLLILVKQDDQIPEISEN
jgi:cadmium resistance transport/sequestration family protein